MLIKGNQIAQVKEYSGFFVWEDTRVWDHWNCHFDMHLSCLGALGLQRVRQNWATEKHSWLSGASNLFFPIMRPFSRGRGGTWGWQQWLRAWRGAVCLSPSGVSSGITVCVGCSGGLCLQIWQAIFFIQSKTQFPLVFSSFKRLPASSWPFPPSSKPAGHLRITNFPASLLWIPLWLQWVQWDI